VVFEFLKFQYYNQSAQIKKSEKYYDELLGDLNTLMTNYNLYCFAPNFLLQTLERHKRLETQVTLYESNKKIFEDYEIDKNNVPLYVIYACYRAICCYNVNRYDEASKYLNVLLNDLSLKKNPNTLVEVKIFLGLIYCLMKDFDLFNQLINSIQRQIRIMGKEECAHIVILIKMMKTTISEYKKGKSPKINNFVNKLSKIKTAHFSPFNYLDIDDTLVAKLNKS
jgi:tetratricopeptide (TPR) repeat protein